MERAFESIPLGRGCLPIVGHFPAVTRDVLRFFLEHGSAGPPIVRFRFLHLDAVLLHDPAAVQHVLQQSPKIYTKSRNYTGMKHVLGRGLLTSEGELWRRQRKLAQPAFHHQKLRALVGTMGAATEDMLARWRTWEPGHRFDLHAEMMRVTLRIAGLTLFGADLDREARDVAEALDVVLPWANQSIERPYRAPLWVPVKENRDFKRALATLDRLVYRIVEERRRDPREHHDLLSMLMGARDESGAAMDDRQLRDEILTIVLAGHETTANAMAWTWMLLARHPEWRARVEEEAQRVLGASVAPSLEDVGKLDVCERVVSESMRLYPPAWEFEREPIVDDVVLGYRIPKGTIVMIAPITLHRHPDLWEEPARFDPDRWLPEHAARRPRYAYLPFGDGPRICIGKAFAMMESKLMVAMMARDARLELEPGAHIAPVASITLRPAGGVPMRYWPSRRAEAPRTAGEARASGD
jgi:cytochrome P450